MIECFIYLRISEDDELEGNGVDNQLRVCTADLPADWVVVDVINDNDTSATSEKPRDGYEDMLGRLKIGQAQAVMAYKQDRLTRKVVEAAALLDLVDSHGVRIAIKGQGVLPLTKGNFDARANFLTSTVNARREIEAISARVTLNCEGRAMKGKPQGKVPFGYRRHPVTDADGQIIFNHKGRIKEKIDVIHEPEAAVIRMAVEQLLAGRSVRSITNEIELGEIRPVGGGAWDTRQVRRLMTMPTYAGLRLYRGQVIGDASWPAIITPAQHHQAVAIFADPVRKAMAPVGRAPKWLLTGIAVCGLCGDGSRLAVQHDRRPGRNAQSVYRCTPVSAQHPGCWASSNVDDVEAWVAAAIKDRLADPKLGEPSEDAADRINALYAHVAKLEGELLEIAGDADLGYAEAKAMGASRRAKIKTLNDQVSELLPQVAQRIKLDWDTADVANRRTVIEQLIKRIELYPGHRVGRKRGFAPEQVRIEWR